MLRELKDKDYVLMHKCMSDPNVNRYMNIDGSKMKPEDCLLFIHKTRENNTSKHFAIVDDNDNWMGTISLKNIDEKTKSAEYAIITSSDAHGKGYAYNATLDILKYAFEEINLNRVYLDVLVDNVRANKFYQKCGFVFEGTFRQAIEIKGNIYDLNWYSMLKSDYDNRDKNIDD